jgi:hypothetical protein
MGTKDAYAVWPEDVIEEVSRLELILADGYEDALIGYVEQFGRPPIALYDKNRCIEILTERDQMTHAEAVEFFEFNTLGAWVGEETPAFATLLRTPQIAVH